jgi:hypothetical protein
MTLGVDLGALTVKIAADGEVADVPAPAGGPRAGIRAVLATASPRGGFCVAIPDAWLIGDVAGASLQEDVRHECEDVAGAGPVTWTGQLAAVAALTAKQRGPGRYLVCDIGGCGVRAGVFEAADGNVEIVATHTADGGWLDFDAAIRSGAAARLPATWYEQAAGQERRASMVFEDAAASPEESGDTRVYRISGPAGHIDLRARHVIDSFAPTLERLRTAIGAVTGTGLPADGVVLTGALSWLPLVARAIFDAVGAAPVVAGLDAAARGALLFARGEARLAPPAECQSVTLPAHRIRNGLLEECSVTLPWTAPFGTPPDGALTIDRDELELTVAGQSRIARLPGLVPGPHRIGVRPTWPGPGVLVVRPVTGDNAHVVPLATLTAR